MEANPYYLKDTEGGYYNKYPEFAVWEEGHQAGEKQGYEKGYNKALAQLADMTEECKQMGRKEVVEWIENRGGSLDGFREEWQAIRNGDYETD